MLDDTKPAHGKWRTIFTLVAACVSLLIAGYNVLVSVEEYTRSPTQKLVRAYKHRKPDQVEPLLRQSIPHRKCYDRDFRFGFFYPIHIAAGMQQEQMLAKLLKEGANVNERDANNETPIVWLFRSTAILNPAPTERCLDLLLAHGADPRQTSSDYHTTALHESVLLTSAGCTIKLLQHGAEVNATRADGSTPLHEACNAPFAGPEVSRMVEVLMKAGANPTLINGLGKTPSDIARRLKRFELVELINKLETQKQKNGKR